MLKTELGVFPDYHELMKKRHKKLLDYDRLRTNVKKLVEKPSSDSSKLSQVNLIDSRQRQKLLKLEIFTKELIVS